MLVFLCVWWSHVCVAVDDSQLQRPAAQEAVYLVFRNKASHWPETHQFD